MNCIEKAIASHSPDFSEQPRKVRKVCVDLIIQYLFRLNNYKTLSKGLREQLEEVNVATLLDHVTNKGYITKNIKMWLYAGAADQKDTRSIYMTRKFKIEKQDQNLGSMLSTKTERHLKKLARKYPAISLEDMDEILLAVRMATHVWCRKFLNKKTLFIMRSEKMTLQDMHNEILYKGFRGLYLMYPMFKSPLHAVNIAKRTMRNQGLNLIQSYTTQKRGKVIRSEDKVTFYSNTVSLSSYEPREGETDSVRAGSSQDIKNSDLHIDVKQFALGLRDKKKQMFVGLLMGIENQGFYDYLKKQKLLRKYDELPQAKFIDVCLDYLGVDRDKGYRFLHQMKQHFGGYSLTTPMPSV